MKSWERCFLFLHNNLFFIQAHTYVTRQLVFHSLCCKDTHLGPNLSFDLTNHCIILTILFKYSSRNTSKRSAKTSTCLQNSRSFRCSVVKTDVTIWLYWWWRKWQWTWAVKKVSLFIYFDYCFFFLLLLFKQGSWRPIKTHNQKPASHFLMCESTQKLCPQPET